MQKISLYMFDHFELVNARDGQLHRYGLDGVEDLLNAAMPMTIEKYLFESLQSVTLANSNGSLVG